MRCDSCGNKTRFDVFESKRVRQFQHYTLGGDVEVEEEEILEHTIEKIVCRWCGSSDKIVDESATDESGSAGSAGEREIV